MKRQPAARPCNPDLHAQIALLAGANNQLMRAHRVANKAHKREDIDWLCDGFSAFLANRGRVPLERCLRLPTSDRALSRARRDDLLCLAWLETDPALSAWQRSEALAAEVRRFGDRKWPRWSTMLEAPDGADAMDRALFEAFRSHERIPGTTMQLHNIAALCRGE